MKKITIKSSVLSVAMITLIGGGASAHAGVFDQLAAVANSALPAYGRVQMNSVHSDLEPSLIEAGIREAISLASDRAAVSFEGTLGAEENMWLSSDLRRARKMAIKMGHDASFDQLQSQVGDALIAAMPATSELFKETVKSLELVEPRSLLASHDTAATDFLRHKVSEHLQKQLQPLVTGLLEHSGATSTSASLAPQIQFGSLLDTIVEDYVIQQSIDGFFNHLEVEESQIRQNPDLRTTDLMQQVFN